MNTNVYHIISYIIQTRISVKSELYLNTDLTRELLSVGFRSDDINLAYLFLSPYLATSDTKSSISEEYMTLNLSFDGTGSLIDRFNELITLFRELNIIDNQKVADTYTLLQQGYNKLDNPDTVFEVLEKLMAGSDVFLDFDHLFLLFPMAFSYRKIS
ncbi:MAG: hypothetical protein KBA26_10785 [Candidatus Delongbacteria bacterium]|nr:hypothetical protein [Candidatus Delongbacteria bacterium]